MQVSLQGNPIEFCIYYFVRTNTEYLAVLNLASVTTVVQILPVHMPCRGL